MNFTSTCLHCQGDIEHTESSLGEPVECPHCGSVTRLDGAAGHPPATPAEPPEQSTCTECGLAFSHPPRWRGMTIHCPHCQKMTRLSKQAPPPPEPEPQPAPGLRMDLPVAPVGMDTPTVQRLKQLRRQSCYPELRSFVNVAFWVVAIGGCLPVLVMAASIASFFGGAGSVDAVPNFTLFFLALIGAGMGLALALVGRQAALLLVDIADTLLEHHGRQGGPERP